MLGTPHPNPTPPQNDGRSRRPAPRTRSAMLVSNLIRSRQQADPAGKSDLSRVSSSETELFCRPWPACDPSPCVNPVSRQNAMSYLSVGRLRFCFLLLIYFSSTSLCQRSFRNYARQATTLPRQPALRQVAASALCSCFMLITGGLSHARACMKTYNMCITCLCYFQQKMSFPRAVCLTVFDPEHPNAARNHQRRGTPSAEQTNDGLARRVCSFDLPLVSGERKCICVWKTGG